MSEGRLTDGSGRRLAVISDIHGNREALDAVLARLADTPHDGLVCLGDIVGYGADPGYCVDRIAALAEAGAIVLRGNHDDAIATGTAGMNRVAAAALDWTRGRLSHGQRAFLAGLPLTDQLGDWLFVHADPGAPADWHYVFDAKDATASFATSTAPISLCGHTHRPAVFRRAPAGRVEMHSVADGETLALDEAARWIAVVGSVGQPRDGRAAAAYCLIDRHNRSISYRREAYDVETAAGKIRAAGLPTVLADRLSAGF